MGPAGLVSQIGQLDHSHQIGHVSYKYILAAKIIADYIYYNYDMLDKIK
jgi:hypothetical protein